MRIILMREYLYIILTVLLFGSSFPLVKLLLHELHPLHILFFSTLFGGLVLLFLSLVLKEQRITSTPYEFFYMSMLGVFLYYTFSFTSMVFISANLSVIINYLWPIFTIVFSAVLFRERVSLYSFFGIGVTFFGVILALGGNGSLNMLGVVLALLGAVSYGLFSTVGKQKPQTLLNISMYFLFSAVFFGPLMVLFAGVPTLSFQNMCMLLWIGGFSSGLGYFFLFRAIHSGHLGKKLSLLYFTPFVSMVLIYFILSEIPGRTAVFGAGLVVLGTLLQFIKN
jgi:drug/metabolite transporter (DMT)-like permease